MATSKPPPGRSDARRSVSPRYFRKSSGAWLRIRLCGSPCADRADAATDSFAAAPLWLILAEASEQVGDQDGYTKAMAKAVSTAKSSGLVNPVYGVKCLSALAEFQWRHQDGDSPEFGRQAVSCGNAVSKVPDKVSRLARCAGLLARLGDREQYDATLQRALDMAQNRVRLRLHSDVSPLLGKVRRCGGSRGLAQRPGFGSGHGILGDSFGRPKGPTSSRYSMPERRMRPPSSGRIPRLAKRPGNRPTSRPVPTWRCSTSGTATRQSLPDTGCRGRIRRWGRGGGPGSAFAAFLCQPIVLTP